MKAYAMNVSINQKRNNPAAHDSFSWKETKAAMSKPTKRNPTVTPKSHSFKSIVYKITKANVMKICLIAKLTESTKLPQTVN